MIKKRTALYLALHIIVIVFSTILAIITDSEIVRWTQVVCAVTWSLCLFIEVKRLIKKKPDSKEDNNIIE